MDWRVSAFTCALTFGVTCVFGALPAIRASMVKPISALKSGRDPHARRRLMRALIAVQVSFCVCVLFVGGLFVETVQQLVGRPMGFAAERVLTLETVSRNPQAATAWDQLVEHLRELPGVESAAVAGFPLLSGQSWNGFVWINGAPAGSTLSFFLGVSPGFLATMRIPLIDGRDLTASDGREAAVVNEAFARTFFNGRHPIGEWFEKTQGGTLRIRFQIVGIVPDVLYQNVREPFTPTAFVPFQAISVTGAQRAATLVVRTTAQDPLALASQLRLEVPRARPEFRVSSIRTQQEIDASQTLRERLLAALAIFFGGVALLLTGIGLYGVLHYTVVQRHRDIGIRRAIGAGSIDVVRSVTGDVSVVLLIGGIAGLALGVASLRYVGTLLYGIRATDASVLAVPCLIMFVTSVLALLPPVIRAARVNPIEILRAE
jgi:predicted permease